MFFVKDLSYNILLRIQFQPEHPRQEFLRIQLYLLQGHSSTLLDPALCHPQIRQLFFRMECASIPNP